MADKPPMDPNVEPPGYEPPTSAKELMERYSKGERYFVGTQILHDPMKFAYLIEGSLIGDLHGANLCDAALNGVTVSADLSGSNFAEARLGPSKIFERASCLTNFDGADLSKVSFEGAQFLEVQFMNCVLSGADLRGAALKDVRFVNSDLHDLVFPDCWIDAEIDFDTFARSRWSPHLLGSWFACGGRSTSDGRFDEAMQRFAPNGGNGLTLYFNIRLTPFDRFLVEGVIFGVLGKNTDCEVVQFEKRGDTAVVRLQATQQEDLEAVADALWERVWDQQERAQQTAAMTLAKGIVLHLQPGLSNLRDKLDHIELRLPGPEAKEMLDDQGKEHWREKNLKLIRSWPEKVARAIGKKAAQKVGDEVADVAADAVQGLLTGGCHPED